MHYKDEQYPEKVCIFVDGSNLYFGLKNAGKETSVDFYKLAKELTTEKRKLIRLYYYNAPIRKEEDEERYKSQQRFFDGLQKTPYVTVRLGRLEKRKGEKGLVYFVEKGVDVSIAVDMLKLSYQNAYDTAILISADGDFATAIEAVKDLGKHTEVAYFKSAFSYHLRNACDKIILLDDIIERCYI